MRLRHPHDILLTMRIYRQNIREVQLTQCKPLSNRLDLHHTLMLSQSPTPSCQHDDIPYHKAISSLMYVALGMHPNIMFMDSFLSQFMQNPGRPNWEAVKRVLYLKGTWDHSLVIGDSGHLNGPGALKTASKQLYIHGRRRCRVLEF